MASLNNLSGKTAIVTGAGHAKGIGRAIAQSLIENGANVIIADRGDSLDDNEIAQYFSANQAQVLALACDVTNSEQIAGVVEQGLSHFGGLDILVNNAGVGVGDSDFLKLTSRDWELSLSVNLLGVANFCQAVLPHFLSQQGGVIINNASLAGLGAIEAIPACYSASKFALVGLTKQLAVNYAANGVRVNAVCPGSINTQMHQNTLALIAGEHQISIEQAQQIEDESIPMGFTAQPSVVGDTVAFLASDAAAYITGVCLPVAGGMSPGI